MKHLNPFIPRSTYTMLKKEGCDHFKSFNLGDRELLVDVNSLDAYRVEEGDDAFPIACDRCPQFPPSGNRGTKMLVLEATHACPLRCDYCFLSHFYPETVSRMSFDTAKLAIDHFFGAAKGKQFDIKIGFFGGEPTLEFDLIRQVVEYVEAEYSSTSTFGVTTNACLINEEMASFFAKHRFSFVLSMDGDPEQHDRHRKHADGSGSWYATNQGLQYLHEAGCSKITLRSTYLPDDIGLLRRAKFLNKYYEDGVCSNVSIEPACLSESRCVSVPEEMVFTVESVRAMQDEYYAVADWMAERLNEDKPVSLHDISVYLRRFVTKLPYSTACGAGVGYVSVSPLRDIYACHREMNSWIGNLDRGGIDEMERAKWVDNRFYQNKHCMSCTYRHMCGGPCREVSIGSTGQITGVDPVACEFYKLRIRGALRVLDQVDTTILERKYHHQAKPESKSVNVESKDFANTINLVREGGGIGDIICMGGAARQIKAEDPDVAVRLCVPKDFVAIADHLMYVDEVFSLGLLGDMAPRRSRCASMDPEKFTYLKRIPGGMMADLWCPGWLHESTSTEALLLSRAQLFAISAGCESVSEAVPAWGVTAGERKRAGMFLEGLDQQKMVLGFAPRGTSPARSLPSKMIHEAVGWLRQRFEVIYLDVAVPPKYEGKELVGVVHLRQAFPFVAAVLEQCDALVTVDTGFLHLAAALGGVPTMCLFGPTDPRPLLGYPRMMPIWYSPEIKDVCAGPCNRSVRKGWSEACRDGCQRMQKLTLDQFTTCFEAFAMMAFDPMVRMERSDRMKEAVECA